MLEDKDTKKTSLGDLGEFGLIEHLTKNIELQQTSTLKGVGDDAAVLGYKGQVVISSDMLVEGVHFNLAYTPLKHLGYKAVVVNLSDIYAMNARATQIMINLAVSNRFPLQAIEELYEGVYQACRIYGVDLIGGDTTSSNKGLILSITALGEAVKDDITYRSGANPNDLLVVSGDLGGAYMGLQVLQRENEVFKVNPNHQPDLEPYAYIVERQLKPEARKDLPLLFKELGVTPTSMIDISDGLSSEILHLSAQSGIGASLYEDKIPLDPTVIAACEEFKLDSTLVALSGGEDYELLFTIRQEDYPKIKANPNFTVIGHMTGKGEGANLIARNDSVIPLKAQGWNALKNPEEG